MKTIVGIISALITALIIWCFNTVNENSKEIVKLQIKTDNVQKNQIETREKLKKIDDNIKELTKAVIENKVLYNYGGKKVEIKSSEDKR